MAQVKPFDWYQYDQPKGIPGGKADATNDDIFSFAAEGGVNPGEAVIRGTNPDSQVVAAGTAGDGAKVIGVAVHTNKMYSGTGDYYEDGYSVPVMFKGDVFVEAGASVTAGAAAGILIDGSDVSWVPASTASAETVTGATFLEDGAEGDIVTLRLMK